MKIRVEKSATIITPTVDSAYLINCIESVQNQTYKNLTHLLVADGPEYYDGIQSSWLNSNGHNIPVKFTFSPENTGANGFYGHRIYAAYPHLINSDYVLFLDEDNWLEPNHVETLIKTIETQNLDWSYSLRNIFTRERIFVAEDCSESLGKWPIHWSTPEKSEYLVDTSSYCFKREFLIQVCQHWHHGWGGDRRFYHIISKIMNHTNYNTSGHHTLNYRLDDNLVKKYGSTDFFTVGNEVVKQRHGGSYPWSPV